MYELPTHFSEEAQDLVNSTLKKTAELRPNIIGQSVVFVQKGVRSGSLLLSQRFEIIHSSPKIFSALRIRTTNRTASRNSLW